jgi:major membrane immunogen (membrane-anchored lipoprotein)
VRRAPIVLTGTALGVAGVLMFHPRSPETSAAITSSPAPASSGTSAGSSSSGAGGSGGSTGGSGSSGTRTVTGKAVSTPYGNAQVRVTITDGRIVKVQALQLQGNDPKSVQISSSAEPTLRQEALQKQSAAIDTVSGATYTSTSYEASLQSALDTAGFKASDGSRGTTTVPQDIPREDDHGGGFGGPPDGRGDGGPPTGSGGYGYGGD